MHRATTGGYYNGSPASPNPYAISAHSAQRKASVPSSPLASRLSPKKMTNNELAEKLQIALTTEIAKIAKTDKVDGNLSFMVENNLKDRSSEFKNKLVDSVVKAYPNCKDKSRIGLRLDRAFDAKVKELLQNKRNELPAWFVNQFTNNRATIEDFCNRNHIKGNTRW
jgi:hypothetical protein